jgi:hypothetical protein
MMLMKSMDSEAGTPDVMKRKIAKQKRQWSDVNHCPSVSELSRR